MNGIGRVAIAGLGLVGGSLARDLAARGVHVSAFDHDEATLRAAHDAGAVHAPLDASLAGSAAADIFVLAVPVHAAPAVLERAAPHLTEMPLITDVGSTKQSIAEAAERLGLGDRFIGGHPLAGSHTAGWAATRTGLFREARVYLCPGIRARQSATALAAALWQGLGATPVVIDAGAHDRLLAWTSHLPQALATTLAASLAAAGVRPHDLGPGGRDMTRLAASPAALWTGIALDNATELMPALAHMERGLAEFRAMLEQRDAAALERLFERGRQALDG
jgi:prephenate dehydrogenase